MANRSLGVLTLDLIARIGGFEQGMDKAARTADKRMREIERRAFAFGKAMGTALKVGAGVAVAGITALAAATKVAIDNADQIRDLSIRLGASTETLSAWGYAASQTGTDMEALSKGLKILAKNAADAINPTSEQAKVFDALGISVTDAAGNLKSLDQLVPQIADKFRQLEDGTTKAALAQALFGKSGLDLTEFLNQGGQGLEEFTAKARALGIVVDSQTAAAADDFNDTLGDLKAQVSGLGLGIARELLPSLKDCLEQLSALIRNGNLAADAATVLSAALGAGVGALKAYENAVARTSIAIEGLVGISLGLGEVQKNLMSLGAADGSVAEGYRRIAAAMKEGQAQLDDLTRRQNNPFANVIGGASTVAVGGKSGVDSTAIARALSNPTAAKAKRSGKSDAEKEAERLQAAYDRLNSSLAEQIALFGKDGEAAKVRYDIEHGELQKLTQAQKDQLIAQAEILDHRREEADLLAQRQRAEQENAQSVVRVLADLKAERDLLGATNEQRATYNALLAAGPGLMEADRQAIVASVHALYEHGKAMAASIEIQDEWRSGLSDAITDVVTGAKSLKDAFKDFFDDFAARVTQMIAERWVEKLFGETGSNGGGSAGGWLSALAGLFGGGKATGGGVQAGMFYRVNEQGPELLSVGGRDFLMMGAQGGHITPNRQVASGGVTQNIYVTGRVDARTAQQMQQEAAVKQRRALARN